MPAHSTMIEINNEPISAPVNLNGKVMTLPAGFSGVSIDIVPYR
ncbi:hypothetical protein [Pectobacterium odoriferum]